MRPGRMFKVVILGNQAVGKTSLMKRYVDKKFSNLYKTTIYADFLQKDMRFNDGTTVTLQIWDTAGQERHQSLGVAYYRGADCCVLVFDVTNPSSFRSIDEWHDEFLVQSNPQLREKFSFVLLGNKIDLLDERKVSTRQAVAWCERHGGIPYFEVSAKEAVNVDVAFEDVVKRAFCWESAVQEAIGDPHGEFEKSLTLQKNDDAKERSWKTRCFC